LPPWLPKHRACSIIETRSGGWPGESVFRLAEMTKSSSLALQILDFHFEFRNSQSIFHRPLPCKFILRFRQGFVNLFAIWTWINFDDLVKSRHSRPGRNPESTKIGERPGFPFALLAGTSLTAMIEMRICGLFTSSSLLKRRNTMRGEPDEGLNC
jgi:hypothetical protein